MTLIKWISIEVDDIANVTSGSAAIPLSPSTVGSLACLGEGWLVRWLCTAYTTTQTHIYIHIHVHISSYISTSTTERCRSGSRMMRFQEQSRITFLHCYVHMKDLGTTMMKRYVKPNSSLSGSPPLTSFDSSLFSRYICRVVCGHTSQIRFIWTERNLKRFW